MLLDSDGHAGGEESFSGSFARFGMGWNGLSIAFVKAMEFWPL
jgi:hypothetical protein